MKHDSTDLTSSNEIVMQPLYRVSESMDPLIVSLC